LTELLIRGGSVQTPEGPRQADVHVTDGVIAAVEPSIDAPGAKLVEARGMYVLPGGVDVHVHSRDPGYPEKEDFASLTTAAAAGGITVVLDMPNTVPAVDSAGVLESKAALAHSKARVDFGLWALIRSTSTPEQLEAMAAAGAIGFKAYLAYSFSLSRKQVQYSPGSDDSDLEAPPDYGTLAKLAPVVARLGLPLAIHAEDPAALAQSLLEGGDAGVPVESVALLAPLDDQEVWAAGVTYKRSREARERRQWRGCCVIADRRSAAPRSI